MFTTEDIARIEKRGIKLDTVQQQIENFKKGFPPLPIVKAAEKGDGITVLDQEAIDTAIEYFDKVKDGKCIVKFVPASGAATRMFKELFGFINDGVRSDSVDIVLENIEKFAFWPELKNYVVPGTSDSKLITTLLKDGLSYGYLPKGLVTFHRYGDECRKAAEEHLVEGAQYGAGNGVSRIHFTVSPEHMDAFKALFEKKLPEYEKKYGVKYEITYSVQQPSTDTIAVDSDNMPFRQDTGNILFRPAGHGALIKNLDAIDADVIFIKTVDNVTTDARRTDTIRYKKALAGIMLKLQAECFKILADAREGKCTLKEVAGFISDKLCIKLPDSYDMPFLISLLDRPIRVCGMVKNEGEPGGGPFWARNVDGTVSLQIAESSQIAPDKKCLMSGATHFNPVDIVCSPRKADGSKYNLDEFVDPATGFISSKTYQGKSLKAMELPGLWNGAMSRWNTIFVDVPITTFSPVKVIQDLLRPEHI